MSLSLRRVGACCLVFSIAGRSAFADPAAGSAQEHKRLDILARIAGSEPAAVVGALGAAAGDAWVGFEEPARYRLRDASGPVRAAAAAALGRLDWPADVRALDERIEALRRATEDPEPAVRRAAVTALGVYPVPSASEALRALSRSVTFAEREQAAAALRGLATGQAVERLAAWMARAEAAPVAEGEALSAARRLTSDPAGPDAAAAMETLVNVGLDSARPFLRFAAARGRPPARLQAVAALGSAPHAADLPLLLGLLADDALEMRTEAARALRGHLGRDVAVALGERLLLDGQTPRLHERPPYATPDPVTELLATIAASLRAQATPDLVVALGPRLGRLDGYARELAVFLVRERRSPEALWLQATALTLSPDPAAHAALLREDRGARERALVPHLADPGLEAGAVLTLLDLVRPVAEAAAGPVMELLAAEPLAEVVTAVAGALGGVPDGRVVPALAAGLERETRPGPRLAFYQALLARGSAPAAAAAAAALRAEKSPMIARTALGLVAGRRERELIDAVAARLHPREAPEVALAALAALESLDAVDDPALVGAVATLAHSEDPELAVAAYRRLRAAHGELAAGHVRRIARHPGVVVGVRALAIEDLGALRGGDERSLLEDIVRRGAAEERLAARRALHRLAPQDYPSWDNVGRLPLVASAAGFGAGLLTLVTRIADREQRELILGIGGAVIGGSTAYLLTLDRDVSLGGAGYFASLGLWGAFGGYSLGRVAGLGSDSRTGSLWSAVAGELLGVGLGALTIEAAGFGTGDVVVANLVAASVGAAAVSGAYLARADRRGGRPVDAFRLGGAAGMLPMALLGRRLEVKAEDLPGIAVTTAFASWVGAFAPLALTADRRAGDVVAGIGVGQAAGLAAGLALVHVRPFTARSAFWLGFGGLWGAGLGGGAGLTWPALHGRRTYQLLELGTLAGAGLAAALGPAVELRETDLALVALMTAAGALSGNGSVERAIEEAGVEGVRPRRTQRQLWGGRLFGTSLGMAAGLGMSQLVDLSPGELAMSAGAGALWGAWAGGVALLSARLDDEDYLSPLFALGAAAGGLSMAAVAPRLRYGAADLALTGSGVVLGAFAGRLTPAYWTPEGRRLDRISSVGGGMVGAGVGATLAGVVSQVVEISPRHVLRIDLGALGGMALGAGIGLLSPAIARRETTALLQGGALVGFAGGALLDRGHDYSSADGWRLALGGGLGALSGSLIPRLWRPGAAPREERLGGILAGLAAGAGLTRLGVSVAPRDGGDVVETAVAAGLGAALGAGAFALELERRTRYRGLLAAGLLGWSMGELASPHTTYTGEDLALVASLAAQGAAGGLAVPRWTGAPDYRRRRAAGAALGAGALGLAGLGLAQGTEIGGGRLGESWYAASLAAAAAYGAADLDKGSGGRGAAAAAGAGSWAGFALALLASSWTRYEGADLTLALTLAAQGALGGQALPYWRGEPGHARARAAGSALGGGALGLGGLALAQVTALESDDVLEAWVGSALAAAVAWGAAGARDGGTVARSRGAAGAGLLGGLGVGLLVAPWTRYSGDDWSWILAGGVVGGWLGWQAPVERYGARAERAQRRRGELAGAGVGVLAAAGVAQALDASAEHAAEGLLVAGVLTAGVEGLARLEWPRARRRQALASELTALGAFVVGSMVAPYTELDVAAAATLLTFSGLGSWYGAFAPIALGVPGEHARVGGALAGAAAGFVLGQGAVLVARPDGLTSLELAFASGVGSLIGYGAGGLLDLGERRSYAGLEVGGLAATALGALAARWTRYEQADASLVMAAGVWGAWHGAWLGPLLDPDTASRRLRGGALLGAGVGLGAGAALAQATEASDADVAEASVMLVAGNLLGAGAGELLRLDRSVALGLMEAGGLAGVVAGLALGPATTYDPTDAGLVALTAAIGASHGTMLRGLLVAPGEEVGADARRGGAALGAGLGLAAGMALSQRLDLAAVDLIEIALATGCGDAIGYGLSRWLELEGRARYAAIELGALGMTALGLLTAERTAYGGSDHLLLVYGAGLGAWLGGWAPRLWDGPDTSYGAGVLLGVGAGGVASAAAAQALDLAGGDAAEVMLGGTLATGFGAGLGMALSRDDRVWVGFMEATGLAGAAAVAAFAPRTSYDTGDAALGALAAIYGVYQGAGLSLLTDANDRQVGGAMLAAGAAGALAGSYLGRYLRLDGTEILMLLAGSAWGLWIGGWGAVVIDEELGSRRDVLALGVGTTAVATDLALVVTSFAISKLVEMPGERFAWINVSGGLGLVAGMAAAALSGGSLSLKAGNLLGCVAGLTFGTVATAFSDFAPRRQAAASEAGSARVAGLLPEVGQVLPTIQVLPSDRPAHPDATSVMFSVLGSFR